MLLFKARLRIKENVSFRLTDGNGNTVKLFQPNAIGVMFRKAFGYVPHVPALGSYEDMVTSSNVVTVDAKTAMATMVGGIASVQPFNRLALGTDSTPADPGDTALGSEITTGGGARAVANAQLTTTDTTDDTLQLDYEWTFTSSFAVNEIGIFNSSNALFARALMPAGTINVGNGMKLHAYYKIDFD